MAQRPSDKSQPLPEARRGTTTDDQRIVFIDLDGTLWEYEIIDPTAAEAIHQAQANGHLIFLCTGRGVGVVPQPVLDIGFDGMITNGGAIARVGDKIVYRRDFSVAHVMRLTDYFYAHDIPFNLQTDQKAYSTPQRLKGYREFLVKRAAIRNEISKQLGLPIPESDALSGIPFIPLNRSEIPRIAATPATSARFESSDPTTLAMVERDLGDEFQIVSGSIPSPAGSSGEIHVKGVTKGAAIAAVLEYLGKSKSAAIGIGDSYNDIEMFEACGTAVAMGNAIPELQAQADFVTSEVLRGGVKDAFGALGLITELCS